jgi:hypothetical protein
VSDKDNHIQYDKVSSGIFGYPVVDWNYLCEDISVEQILTHEKQCIEQYNARYISLSLPCAKPHLISAFEECGFKFIQHRLNIQKQLSSGSYNLYPFVFIPLSDKIQLKELLKKCNKLFFDDRYSTDPTIGKSLSLQRNKQFLINSFQNNNQRIYILWNRTRKTIDGFRTYDCSKKGVASVLLGGAVKNDKVFEYDKILNYLEMDVLYSLNIRKLSLVVSTTNHPEINRYISELGYRVISSSVIMKKIIDQ